MISVLPLPELVDWSVRETQRPWSVEECRPARCAACEAGAREADGRLNLVGHGGYERQGLGGPKGRAILLWIRRFLCLSCKRTQSVLPDWLHPWRWYVGDRIVEALWRVTVAGEPMGEVREDLTGQRLLERDKGWRTMTRWKQDLLKKASLFGWLGSAATVRLGLGALLSVVLLARPVGGPSLLKDWSVETVRAAARSALAGTTHGQGRGLAVSSTLPTGESRA